MSDIIKVILQIDRQHNGYVTVTELDDILKLTYPEDLKNKDTKPLMRKYASIQNRVLVDYKKFRESILDQVNLLLESR
jgi:Ca2+-binding EF-hand superfamily protein